MQNRIRSAEDLQAYTKVFDHEIEAIQAASAHFDLGISPYYASLMDPDDPNCPIKKQAIPTKSELIRYPNEIDDPLAEEIHMPVKGVTHRYPDRAIWYLSHNCAVFCRFCTRKRKVSQPFETPNRSQWNEAIEYFRKTTSIREVILSGGDPLSLSDSHLDFILSELKSIEHINQIRIHSRHPVTMPMRITDELCKIFDKYFPLYLVTHFNHPRECTTDASKAIERLVRIGSVSVMNQSVLLKGINDDLSVLEELNYRLVSMGVKPYYLHQCDEVFGISHFRVPIREGLELYRGLRGRMSGITVPLYVADLTGGGGKVPLIPEYFVGSKENSLVYRNYKGELYEISDGEIQ
ncbi:KamA family radical SAM protein [Leptospira sp. GIMC2001]|nr:KamA family radical SAM protein [Leptospira sp. GIMC2001]WCL47825.1 KamA family radical SAM protein [Leptospira sp. GIMC2001]